MCRHALIATTFQPVKPVVLRFSPCNRSITCSSRTFAHKSQGEVNHTNACVATSLHGQASSSSPYEQVIPAMVKYTCTYIMSTHGWRTCPTRTPSNPAPYQQGIALPSTAMAICICVCHGDGWTQLVRVQNSSVRDAVATVSVLNKMKQRPIC